jgi:hypothetical protein
LYYVFTQIISISYGENPFLSGFNYCLWLLKTKKKNITIKKLTSIVEKNGKNARSHAVSDLGGTNGKEVQ